MLIRSYELGREIQYTRKCIRTFLELKQRPKTERKRDNKNGVTGKNRGEVSRTMTETGMCAGNYGLGREGKILRDCV